MFDFHEERELLESEPGISAETVERLWEEETLARSIYSDLSDDPDLHLVSYREFLAHLDCISDCLVTLPSLYALDLLNRAGFYFRNLYEFEPNQSVSVNQAFLPELLIDKFPSIYAIERHCFRMPQFITYCGASLKSEDKAFLRPDSDCPVTLKKQIIYEMSRLIKGRYASRSETFEKEFCGDEILAMNVFDEQFHWLNSPLTIGDIIKHETSTEQGPIYAFLQNKNLIKGKVLVYPNRSRNDLYDYLTYFNVRTSIGSPVPLEELSFKFLMRLISEMISLSIVQRSPNNLEIYNNLDKALEQFLQLCNTSAASLDPLSPDWYSQNCAIQSITSILNLFILICNQNKDLKLDLIQKVRADKRF